MTNLQIDYSKILNFIHKNEVETYKDESLKYLKSLVEKSGKGNDFLGWIDLPENSKTLYDTIYSDAKRISKIAEVVVIIGIGGSYLGAKAVIDALNHHFSAFKNNNAPHILYAGQNISEDYLNDLLEILDQKEYALTVISKSGTTTEPAIAFRLLKNHLENKYGKTNAQKRIIAITDKEKGALKELSNQEGYKTYIVPDDVGGRYSVLSPVGLLPIAIAGFDIQELVKGAEDMKKHIFSKNTSFEENPALVYAACRNALFSHGYQTEIMVNYEPRLFYIAEWWKQLYGESEGKENKGIFPASVSFTTDLHSMGQYIQDGLRNLFETVISVKNSKHKIEIPIDNANLDTLNYISGKRLTEVNHMAEIGTSLAHLDGGVPNLKIEISEISEYNLGQLIYFFEIGCAISGYIIDVNPFDQPGVEDYKKNMFALLGKPGFEKETKKINERLK
jgi:glucose-6-phosphate isomerase